MADLPEGFDLDTLLAPISDEQPAGADQREDFSPQSLYFRLRDARSEARDAERVADGDRDAEDVPPPQWRTIATLAVQALSTRTKDLEIAAWYCESLIRGHGLPGLIAGTRLITGLVDRYWDGLYPTPDEDGIATRVAPITGMNGQGGDGTLIQPLRKTPLFRKIDGAPVPFFKFLASMELAGIADEKRRAQRIKAGAVPFADMDRDSKAAPKAAYGALRDQIALAQAAWKELEAVLEAKAGSDAPPTGRVAAVLQELREVVDKFAPPPAVVVVEEAPGEDGEPGADGAAAAPGTARAAAARVVTREDMLAELNRIADWFRRQEPQSPLAYTIEEAIRRGKLTWPELLAELVADAGARNNILNTLGIKPAPP